MKRLDDTTLGVGSFWVAPEAKAAQWGELCGLPWQLRFTETIDRQRGWVYVGLRRRSWKDWGGEGAGEGATEGAAGARVPGFSLAFIFITSCG